MMALSRIPKLPYILTLDTYLLNELLPFLPDEFKRSFLSDVLLIIAGYWDGGFQGLTCPVSGEYFKDPVIIAHDWIAPIIYSRQSVMDALTGELSCFNLNENTIRPVPFIKNLVHHFRHRSTQFPLGSPSSQYVSAPLRDAELVGRNNLMDLFTFAPLRDAEVVSRNNLMHILTLEIERARRAGSTEIDLADILNQFDQPLLEKRPNHFFTRLNAEELLLLSIVGAGVGLGKARALHMYYRFHGWTYHGVPMYAPSFVVGSLSQVAYDIFTGIKLVSYCNLYHEGRNDVMNILMTTLSVIALYSVPGVFNDVNIVMDALFSIIAMNLLLLKKDNLLRQLGKPSSLTLLLGGVSMANLALKWYYEQEVAEKRSFTMAFEYPHSLSLLLLRVPRVILTSHQTAYECRAWVKRVARNRFQLFQPAPDAQGFVPEKAAPYFLKSFGRMASAFLMGILAFTVSASPAFAVIAALAMFSDFSYPNIVSEENTGYRLKQRR